MKETFYFSHDYNARSDEKMKKLIMKHGTNGYGIFWWVIEDLYQNANALHLDYECIAYETRQPVDVVKSVIEDFGLFETKGGKISSKSVQDRLGKRDKKSAKARESAKARWSKKDANAMRTQSECNAIKESKVKENKVKENKVKENKESNKKYGEYKNVLLTPTQEKKLIKDYGEENFNEYLKKLDEYIQVKRPKYKDHNLVLRNWLNRDNKSKITNDSGLSEYDKRKKEKLIRLYGDKWEQYW